MWVSVPSSNCLNVFNFAYPYSTITTYPRAKVAWVTWRPPAAHLHYPELYAGIYEYLRVEPSSGRRESAEEYLQSLLRNTIGNSESPFQLLQKDRIEWVRAWLAELDGKLETRKFKGKIN